MSFRRIVTALPRALRPMGKNFQARPSIIGMTVEKAQTNAGLFSVSCRAFASAKAEVGFEIRLRNLIDTFSPLYLFWSFLYRSLASTISHNCLSKDKIKNSFFFSFLIQSALPGPKGSNR